jgi:hypothetical protein
MARGAAPYRRALGQLAAGDHLGNDEAGAVRIGATPESARRSHPTSEPETLTSWQMIRPVQS